MLVQKFDQLIHLGLLIGLVTGPDRRGDAPFGMVLEDLAFHRGES